MNDIKRPKQKVNRQIKRSNIALDDYMFERKMQSLYYGIKPKSDDTPLAIKLIRRAFYRSKKEIKLAPKTARFAFLSIKKKIRKYPVRFLAGALAFGELVRAANGDDRYETIQAQVRNLKYPRAFRLKEYDTEMAKNGILSIK